MEPMGSRTSRIGEAQGFRVQGSVSSLGSQRTKHPGTRFRRLVQLQTIKFCSQDLETS